jgi:MFS family permease
MPPSNPRTIIGTYLATTALFTLSTSIIWGVNTLFLLGAGLTLFQVFAADAFFSGGDLLFQIPTGVVADTIGRKFSFLLSLATLVVSTLAYLAAAKYHMGFWAFAGASVFLGLGFTFYSGAVDAWLVDALNRAGYEGTREQVFAWGGMAFSGAQLVGTLAGGLLGQLDLSYPYLARAGMLSLTFVLAAVFMHEPREDRPPLGWRAFADRSREVAVNGLGYVRRNPVVRPMVVASGIAGFFFIFGVYSWQRYFLDLLGREAVWVNGVVASLGALAGIVGNSLVSRVTRGGTRPAGRILATLAAVAAVVVIAIGAVGLLLPPSVRGIGPFLAVVALWLTFSAVFGVFRPIRQAFINPHIRSEERATVLSIDYLVNDVGGVLGGPTLGAVSQWASIPTAWVIGGVVLLALWPLYRRAHSAAERSEGPTAVVAGHAPQPRIPGE